jgi:hypothetical protein
MKLIISVLVAFYGLLLMTTPINAQVSATPPGQFSASSVQHVFRDMDDNVLVEGTFQQLAGLKAEIRSLSGEIVAIPLSTLCDDDKNFVRDQIQFLKQQEKAADVIQSAAIEMSSNKPNGIIEGSKKIRRLGKFGDPGTAALLSAMSNSTDDRTRYEVFITFVTVTGITDRAPLTIFSMLKRTENTDIMRRIQSQPSGFLDAYATLEYVAIPYLKYVAFTGELMPTEDIPSAPAAPTQFEINNSQAQRLRATAVSSLSKIADPVSLSAILDVLAVAEKPVLGQTDKNTIEACLTGLGKLKMADEEALEALERYAAEYPDIVKKSKEQIAEANSNPTDGGQ